MCCRVGACCCITDLRFATLIISVLSLLGNVGLFTFTAWWIKVVRQALLLLLNDTGSGEKGLLLVQGLRVGLAILVVMLLMSLVAVVLDVVLFYGAFRRRRDMVQCWSHGHAVVSGAYLVYFWMTLVGLFANGYIFYGFIALALAILVTVATVYFWIVVRSYDFRLHRATLSTVSGGNGPSSTNSYMPASSPTSASSYIDKPLHHSPPPYTTLP